MPVGALGDGRSAQAAAARAVEADVVVAAIDWDDPPCYNVVQWFFSWPERRRRPGGVLLLTGERPAGWAALWRGVFCHVAEVGGLGYWCEWDGGAPDLAVAVWGRDATCGLLRARAGAVRAGAAVPQACRRV
jgi:hypothetical protein